MKFSSVFVKMIFAFCFLFISQYAFADGNEGGKGNEKPPTTEQLQEQMKAIQKKNEDLELQLAEANKGKKKKKSEDDSDDGDDDESDDDLGNKAAKNRVKKERQAAESKQIEAAIGFNMSIDKFVDDNKEILPTSIGEIVALAHKETYENAFTKANALRASLIKNYFSVEDNLNFLTNSQKIKVQDYLKLTVEAREENSQDIYSNVFEPSFEMMKKLKKAEEVNRSRNGSISGSSGENNYKNKLIKLSKQTHLGEKGA